VGPVLAAQFGYLPGTLWIVIGCVLGGAVQDFVILFASMRRDGKSLGQMATEEVNKVAGVTGMLAVLFIMVILLAVLALIVVNALRDSPWGLCSPSRARSRSHCSWVGGCTHSAPAKSWKRA
jgi:carbon starvation protein